MKIVPWLESSTGGAWWVGSPIGSIPRPLRLIDAIATRDGSDPALEPMYDAGAFYYPVDFSKPVHEIRRKLLALLSNF